MSSQQPTITDASGKRIFACSAVAVQAIIVNTQEEILLLSSPTRNPDGAWQVVSGALDAQETVLEGVLREAREEIGPAVRLRPLGTVHVHTFHYDDKVQYVIGIYYLLAYEGGPVQPGDDMQGSQFRWWSLEALASEAVKLHIPRGHLWVLERGVGLYRLWQGQTAVDLEAPN